jgi:endonuclease/exonuclease/phosphatase family metal-dependent hydrolase
VFPPRRADGSVAPNGYTYVPWGSNRPDRTIDYAFGRGITVHSASTIAAGAAWSDHLPIRLELSIGEK